MGSRHHIEINKLARLSARLEELISLARSHDYEVLPPEVTDEAAATGGEIMLLLAAHGADESVGVTLTDARRLREAARSYQSRREELIDAGAALSEDVERVIREAKRAA